MATDQVIGAIVGLWRFPVKSMLGEKLDEVEVTERGLIGDRAFGLIDAESGKVVSAKNPKLWPDLFSCRAAFLEPPRATTGLPPVRITLSNGTSVTSDAPNVDAILSGFFRRDVRLAQAAPEDFTIDQYHPAAQDVEPTGDDQSVTETKLGAAAFAQAGLPSAVPIGSFFDVFPVSVLTTSTLDRLNAIRPESRFDERRFRMNVTVGTHEPGLLENEWVDRALQVGDSVRLRGVMPDPRCVMITLAQHDLPKDVEILRTVNRYSSIEIPGIGLRPCAGLYAVVESVGTLRKGHCAVLA
jgi:MOSC domain-containing protein